MYSGQSHCSHQGSCGILIGKPFMADSVQFGYISTKRYNLDHFSVILKYLLSPQCYVVIEATLQCVSTLCCYVYRHTVYGICRVANVIIHELTVCG